MGHPTEAVYDSVASSSVEEKDDGLFDVKDDEATTSETNATDIEDLRIDLDADDDLEDRIQLFGGRSSRSANSDPLVPPSAATLSFN